MPKPTILSEPDYMEESQKVQEYWGLISRVASTHRPVIVRRGVADVVAVIAVEHLELLQDLLARQEAEQLAAQIDWGRAAEISPPSQEWLEGHEPRPF